MLKQDAMTPLYVQLMDTVEKDIKSGRYKPGDKIMTESEMAKTYGVSLITVRKAIGSLMEKGLVVRKQGKGVWGVASCNRHRGLHRQNIAHHDRTASEGNDKRLRQGDRIEEHRRDRNGNPSAAGDSEYQKVQREHPYNVEHRVLRKYRRKVSGHELEHDIGEHRR